jgi:hypothetical protein
MTSEVESRCVDRIPDVAYVRDELSRNLRERDILQKLLRLAERKAALIDDQDDGTGCEVRYA